MGAGEVKDQLESPRQRAEALREELAYHDHRYHVLEYPLISRARYWALRAELSQLEVQSEVAVTPDSASLRYPSGARVRFERVRHGHEWLERSAISSQVELRRHVERFAGRDGPPTFVGSAALIGLPVALTYVDGFLEQALLRGDGELGEDVTDNVRTIGSVPLKLRPAGSITESRVTRLSRQSRGPSTTTPVPPCPSQLVVEGVLTMRTLDLQAFDRRRIDAGEPPFVSPNAAVEASVRRLDPEVTASRRLKLFAIDAFEWPSGVESQWQMLGALKSWGFCVTSLSWRCEGLGEILEYIGALQEEQPSFEYPLGGGLLHGDRRFAQSGVPRSVRLSFTTVARRARVSSVYRAVGRTGTIFPVALLERIDEGDPPVPEGVPVPALSGSAVVDIRAGDQVRMLPGAIAPLLEVDQAGERPTTDDLEESCPACSAPLYRPADEPFGTCTYPECKGRLRARLLHIIGPRGLRLRSLNSRNVDALLSRPIRNLAELLTLDPRELGRLVPGAETAFRGEVSRVRRMPLWRVLYLSSIPQVGERLARLIAARVGGAQQLLALTYDELERLGLPLELVAPLSNWLHEEGHDMLRVFAESGIEIVGDLEAYSAPFLDKKLVLAGKLDPAVHERAIDEIERRGGTVEPRVSRRTDLLIVGPEPGPAVAHAEAFRVVVLEHAALLRLVRATGNSD